MTGGRYDFDTILDRKGTESLKWMDPPGQTSSRYADILPMWVADIDIASPPAVVEALRARAAHPVYGYAYKPEKFFGSFTGWMRRRFALEIDRTHVVFSPGIVPAIGIAIQALTAPGDGVVIMPPVYHPFKRLVEDNGRTVLEAPLRDAGGRYELDLQALEAACSSARMLIFCSPHNPVGRVWTAQELDAVIDIAVRHDVLVFADEIHADLVFRPYVHLPLHGRSQALQKRLVSSWAPSKTFNIAGLQSSFIVIPDDELRARYVRQVSATGQSGPNCMAVEAVIAAYDHGADWLDELLVYLRGNYEFLVSELAVRAPALGVYPCEGTYLAWVDFRGAGLDGDVGPALIDRAGLWLDAGARFGTGGGGFARLNLGAPRAVMDEAVRRLAGAFGQG